MMVTDMENKIKIKDFIKLLKNLERLFVESKNSNSELLKFLKKLRELLNSYKNMSGDDFLNLFEIFLSNHKKKEKQSVLKDINIEKISFIELRKILESNSFTKEELLEIGEKKFSIAKGSNQKLNKEQLKELIESAMKNLETLDAIKNKAAE